MQVFVNSKVFTFVEETTSIGTVMLRSIVDSDKLDPKHPVDCLILRHLELADLAKNSTDPIIKANVRFELSNVLYKATDLTLPSEGSIIKLPVVEGEKRTFESMQKREDQEVFGRLFGGQEPTRTVMLLFLDAEMFPDDPALPIESLVQA